MKFTKTMLPLLVLASFSLLACGPTTTPETSDNTPSITEPETSDTPVTSETESVDPETLAILVNIYGENAKYGSKNVIENAKFANLTAYYNAKDANGVELGNVFIANGENQYGKITLAVGINKDATIGKVFLVENGQSFGEKLQTEYVDKYNKGEITFDDVTCGATFGATLINTLGKQAQNYYNEVMLGIITDFSQFNKEIFGENAVYGDHEEINDEANVNLEEFWMASDKSSEKYIGRVYHAALPGQHAVLHLIVGVKKDGSYHKAYLVNKAPNEYGEIAQSYVDGLNDGTIKLDEEIKNGATGTSTGIHDLIVQVLAHAKANPIVDKVNYADFLVNLFGDKVAYAAERNTASEAFVNVAETWAVKDLATGEFYGRAYHMALPGQHGVMHIMVGVNFDGSFAKAYLANRAPGQYGDIAQTYVDGLNNGTIKLEDKIENGATGTSTGIRDLIKQAIAHYDANKLVQFDEAALLKNTFGETVTYVEKTEVKDEANVNIIRFHNVKEADALKGRVYTCGLLGKHSTLHLLVGVNKDGTLAKLYLVEKAPNQYGEIAQSYVDGLNNGSIKLDDKIQNGATGTSSGIQSLAKQALAHYASNPIA